MKPYSHRAFGWALKSIYGDFIYPKFYRYKKDAIAFAKYNCSNHPKLDYKTIYKIIRVEIIEAV
jgi:hypothetical protein